jgi:signal peptidase
MLATDEVYPSSVGLVNARALQAPELDGVPVRAPEPSAKQALERSGPPAISALAEVRRSIAGEAISGPAPVRRSIAGEATSGPTPARRSIGGAAISGSTRKRRSPVGKAIWDWYWLGLVGCFGLAYAVANLVLPKVLDGDLNIYLAQPALWTAVAAVGIVGWRFGPERKPRTSRTVVAMGLLLGCFHVAAFVLSGLVFGFGRSPYGHQLLVLLGNLLYAGSALLAIEVGRGYLVAAFSRGNHVLAVATTALFFALINLPFAKFTSIGDAQGFFRLQGETVLPAVSESLLASFLAFLAGPLASLMYRGALVAFEWLSPALPSLPWTVTAFLGTMVPAFSLIVLRNQLMPALPHPTPSRAERDRISTPWILVAATAVGLLWFNAGLLGYQPTLVSGVSMEPALQLGDIVVTREVEPEDIAVGDIVRYQQGGSYIIHRVIEIERTEASVYFLTQGDANNVADPPLAASALRGKVIATVPKLGWVSIAVRNVLELFTE